MTVLDTLLDTLKEGRHSFLDFSTFPDLLKSFLIKNTPY